MKHILNSENSPIYFLVPGFLGNYTENFIGNLADFLLKREKSFVGVEFDGYREEDGGAKLSTLDEMSQKTLTEYKLLRKDFLSRPIVILAYSQGCAVSLKVASQFDEKTSLILFNPAIFLERIILPRIGEDDMRRIANGEAVNCKISKTKSRLIDLDWIDSYRNFSILELLPRIKQECLIVRGIEDYIGKNNVDILRQNLPNSSYIEMSGDHAFMIPKAAFADLVEKIFP